MLKTRLISGLFAALLLGLSACNSGVETPDRPSEALSTLAMDNCDKILNKNDWFFDNGINYFTDAQGRPAAAATSPATSLGDPNRTTPAPRDRNCQRKVGGYGFLPEEYDGGHLIGSNLGGWGKRANLVPQNSSMNRGLWRDLEDQAARCKYGEKEDGTRWDEVYMNVTAIYPDEFQVVPSRLEMKFSSYDGVTNAYSEEVQQFLNTSPGSANRGLKKAKLINFLKANDCG